MSESGFTGFFWRASLIGRRLSAFVLAGFSVMAKIAIRAKRNPENTANPVNPDSDKDARLANRARTLETRYESQSADPFSLLWAFKGRFCVPGSAGVPPANPRASAAMAYANLGANPPLVSSPRERGSVVPVFRWMTLLRFAFGFGRIPMRPLSESGFTGL